MIPDEVKYCIIFITLTHIHGVQNSPFCILKNQKEIHITEHQT